MSNSLAIAAVTTTLQNLLFSGLREELGSGSITSLPLDKARSNSDSNQINLFLYHAAPNPAWRNRPKMTQVKRGISDEPPLGLDLYYLIVAYGKDEDEVASHQLLGRVMSIFHDHKILKPAEIIAATSKRLPESNLHEQIDGLNIVPQSLSFDEISKIWQVFEAQYRASVAYQISVVVLDSHIPVKVALPVLPQTNGRAGGRPLVNIGVPTLKEIHLPHRQRSAQFGDILTLRGTLMNRLDISVQLLHPLLDEAIALSPLPEPTETELSVQIPDRAADAEIISHWVAGFYSLSVVVPREEYQQSSEELPLALAPQVLNIATTEEQPSHLTIEVTCIPRVHPAQRAVLLLGNRGIPLHHLATLENPGESSVLTFRVRNVPSGDYVVRLRVDGVDSIPVDFTTAPFEFARGQRMEVGE